MYKILMSAGTGVDEYDIDQLERGCWIDVVAPTPAEIDTLVKATKIQRDFLTASLDSEEKSRTEVDEDQLLVVIDIPFLRSNKDYDTMPLGIILTQDYIMTVCLEANAVTAAFNAGTYKTFSTYKKTRFLFQILYKSATLYLKYIRNIIRRTDDLEHHLRQAMENSKLFSMLDLQKSLTYFTTSLKSNYMVTEKLLRLRSVSSAQKLVKMYEEDEDLLEDVIIENKQAKEMVEMYAKILARLADTFSSIISNNQNLVMKFLAAMTIILAIPTVISSFFGMNVPVPLADNPYGFFYVTLMAGSIAGASAYVLYHRDMF